MNKQDVERLGVQAWELVGGMSLYADRQDQKNARDCIFAAMVLNDVERKMRRRGYRAVADELRDMAASLTAKDGQ